MIAHEHISLDELEVSDGRFLNNDTHYYETDQITKIPGITNHKYNALHLNIRSLPQNIELLRTMLDQLNDMIALKSIFCYFARPFSMMQTQLCVI